MSAFTKNEIECLRGQRQNLRRPCTDGHANTGADILESARNVLAGGKDSTSNETHARPARRRRLDRVTAAVAIVRSARAVSSPTAPFFLPASVEAETPAAPNEHLPAAVTTRASASAMVAGDAAV
ncbi:MAG: hypothetical protein ABI717_09810 [Actinomycetota bacterium]